MAKASKPVKGKEAARHQLLSDKNNPVAAATDQSPNYAAARVRSAARQQGIDPDEPLSRFDIPSVLLYIKLRTGWTNDALAINVGLSKTQLQRVMRAGHSKPESPETVIKVIRVAQANGVDVPAERTIVANAMRGLPQDVRETILGQGGTATDETVVFTNIILATDQATYLAASTAERVNMIRNVAVPITIPGVKIAHGVNRVLVQMTGAHMVASEQARLVIPEGAILEVDVGDADPKTMRQGNLVLVQFDGRPATTYLYLNTGEAEIYRPINPSFQTSVVGKNYEGVGEVRASRCVLGIVKAIRYHRPTLGFD